MKKSLSLLFLILLATSLALKAGEKGAGFLVTDRDVYVSGQNLLAKVFVPQDQDFNVVYLILSSINGELITSAKLKVEQHQASGYLYLPDSLNTGSFLLSAYSPHFVKQGFFNKEIFVVNRFFEPDKSWSVERADLQPLAQPVEGPFRVQGLKKSYQQRETVSLSFQIERGADAGLDSCLSIVVSEVLPGWQPRQLPVYPDFEYMQRMAQATGVVLEGQVDNTKTGAPVSGAIVYLSIPDSIPYFDYYRTDDDGRFYFLLKDFYETHSLVLQATKDGENNDLKIRVDNHLAEGWKEVKAKPIDLSPDERAYFSDAVSVAMFQKIYHEDNLELTKLNCRPTYPFPFYGHAAHRVDPNEYFELENFNEISKELLPAVRFRERNGAYSLNMINWETSGFFTGLPLILLDGIPVQKVDQIAKLGTREIDWIDVVPYERYYGDQRFDGVLAIYTKALDGSRMAASNRILKLNYESLQGDILLKEPGDHGPHLPDFRQLLLWQPKVDVRNEMPIDFTASDILGTFKLLITGRKKNGEIVQSTYFFNVTK
jgi:hypothetical protein